MKSILLIFFISLGLQFGDSTNHTLNSYDVYSEIGGTVLLPCVEKLDKGYKNTDCIWTSTDSDGESDTVISASGSIPSPDPRFKIVGDWQNGNCSLQISSVKEEDKKAYSCMVYPSKQHVSKVELLFGNRTKHVHIIDNTTLAFCIADGFPYPFIRWQYKEEGDNKWSIISYTEHTILDHPGQYKCQARNVLNGNEWIESDNTVYVNESNTNLPVENVRIEMGYQFNVSVGDFGMCVADGYPLWFFSWNFIDLDGDYWSNISHTQNISFPLPGLYICQARNKYNEYGSWIRSSNQINVTDKEGSPVRNVRIEVSPEFEGIIGDFATCVADGDPLWTFRWIIIDHYGHYVSNFSNNQSFIFPRPGFYECEARNEYNEYGSWVRSSNQINITDKDNDRRVTIKTEWEEPTLGDVISCETTPSVAGIKYKWNFKKHLDFYWKTIGSERKITLFNVGLYYCEATHDDVWVRSSNRIIVRNE